MNWQSFVVEHGARIRPWMLVRILGRTEVEIARFRIGKPRSDKTSMLEFDEAFALWHGRLPLDEEWPAPRNLNSTGYEWQSRELVLLATLVGTMTKEQISSVLTERLRKITGDPTASRSFHAVQSSTNRLGLWARDVIGGICPIDAGREIGTPVPVYRAIDRGELPVKRVGIHLVIPHEDWSRWKARRTLIPDGYVRLASIREALAIKSDKLPEWARMGHIPTAVQCNMYGANGKTTQGVWYIAGDVAKQLIEDRKAGRPMPWHGKPNPDNLRKTWATWLRKRHPDDCPGCREIWGHQPPPETLQEFCVRYPPLSHGAKRHLTFKPKPALSVLSLAMEARCTKDYVRRAISNGVLRASGNPIRISRIDATLWISRNKPSGDSEQSWISRETAHRTYGLEDLVLDAAIAEGRLQVRRISNGPKSGEIFVSRQQCRELRDSIGFSVEQVASKLEISLEHTRELLQGLEWRGGERISPDMVNAMGKRLKSRFSLSLEEVAAQIGKPQEWIQARVDAGLVKTRRARWSPDRQTISRREVEVLRSLVEKEVPDTIPRHWLLGQAAAQLAGVTPLTLFKWSNEGTLAYRQWTGGRKFDPEAVKARARQYWATCRRTLRNGLPAWLLIENGKSFQSREGE